MTTPKERRDFIERTMPLPKEMQRHCPAILPEAPVDYCYLKGATCDCADFRNCPDYQTIVVPALDRRRYRV